MNALSSFSESPETPIHLLEYPTFVHVAGNIVDANGSFLQLIGVSHLKDIIGVSELDFIHSCHHQDILERILLIHEVRVQKPVIESWKVSRNPLVVAASVYRPIAQGVLVQLFEIPSDVQDCAHTLKNQVMVLGYLKDTGSDEAHWRDRFQTSIDKITHSTKSLITGGLTTASPFCVIDVSQVLGEEINHYLEMFSGVRIALNIRKHAWIAGQKEKLVSVFRNLMFNAVTHGIPKGGNLDIELDTVEYTSAFLPESCPWVRPGGYAKISFTDDGIGMTADQLKKVRAGLSFTTHQNGTGYGLPFVFDTVCGYRGFVQVASEPLRGTKVTIYLPVHGSDSSDTIS